MQGGTTRCDGWRRGSPAIQQVGKTLLETLADRIASRIEDVRSASKQYRHLASRREATETELHAFIRKHPWLLGLEYIRVLPKQKVLRGEVDFLVQRHDGYHDLLELKGPNDVIVRTQSAGDATTDGPHSPSRYSLGPVLAQVLAHVQHYRAQLTTHEAAIEKLYGIRHTRDARVAIIIGRAGDLSEVARMGQVVGPTPGFRKRRPGVRSRLRGASECQLAMT